MLPGDKVETVVGATGKLSVGEGLKVEGELMTGEKDRTGDELRPEVWERMKEEFTA